MAALTRSGARKASEIVILTLRTLHFSRAAICSKLGHARSPSSVTLSPPLTFSGIICRSITKISSELGARFCGGSTSAKKPYIALGHRAAGLGNLLRDPNWLLGGGFCRSRCWLGYHDRIGNRLRNVDGFRAGLMSTKNHAGSP